MKSVATHRGGTAHSVTTGPHRQHSVILWVSRAIFPGQCLLTHPRVTSNCPQLRAWPTSLRTTAANSPSKTTLMETGLSPTRQCHNVPGCLRLNSKRDTIHPLFNGKYDCYWNVQNMEVIIFPFSKAWKFCHVLCTYWLHNWVLLERREPESQEICLHPA